MFPVTTRTDPARRLAAVAHKGPYPEIGRAFEKLGATVAARGLYGRFGHMVAIYYDSPSNVKPADLRSHACLECPVDMVLDPPLEEVTLPAGRHAVLTFTGPYDGFPAAYNHLLGVWLPQSGEVQADSPIFEVYLNSPMDTPPEALVTEICLPLR